MTNDADAGALWSSYVHACARPMAIVRREEAGWSVVARNRQAEVEWPGPVGPALASIAHAALVQRTTQRGAVTATPLDARHVAVEAADSDDWHSFSRAMPDLMLLVDRELRVVAVNHALAAPAGAASAIGAGLFDLLPCGDERARVTTAWRRGVSSSYRSTQTAPNGGVSILLVQLVPRRSGGALRDGMVVARDITFEEQARDRAAHSDARVRTVFEQAPVGMIELSLDATVKNVNERACEIFGLERAQLVGQPGRVVAERISMPLDESFVRALVSGEVSRHVRERAVRHPDGAQHHVRISISVVRGASGVPSSLFAVVEDVDAQHAATRALRDAARRNQAMLSASPSTVLRVGRDGVIRDMHLGSERVPPAGLVPDRPIGQVFPAAEALFTSAIAAACNNPGQVMRFELASSAQAGARVHDEVRVVAWSDDEAVVVLRDVTSYRIHADELERSRSLAQAASRAKSSFLANMSHELRTPLNAVIGFSELLELEHFGPLTDRQRAYVENILQSGKHLLALINDVLDLSKIEAGKLTLVRERGPVAPVVDAVLRELSPLADKAGVALSVEHAPGVPDAEVDPLRLRQVVTNLVSNAIKFTPAGGKVCVRVSATARELAVAVEDTGRGISPEGIARLFQQFEQLDEGPERKEGTGLGLALVRRIVELHGGRVTVDSAVGRGSTFTAVFPLGDPPRAHTPALPLAALGRPMVLTVGPGVDDCLEGVLRSLGFDVQRALPADAAALCRDLRPAAVIVDGAGSAPTDGGGAAGAHPEEVPVPVVALCDDEHERDAATAGGAAAVLARPADRASLARALRALGLEVSDLSGVRVCLVENGAAAPLLELVDGELRRAGCVVRREQWTGDPQMVSGPLHSFEPDVAVLDFHNAPDRSRSCLSALASASAPRRPVVLAVGARPADIVGYRGGLSMMPADVATAEPDRLVRAIAGMLAHRNTAAEQSRTAVAPSTVGAA